MSQAQPDLPPLLLPHIRLQPWHILLGDQLAELAGVDAGAVDQDDDGDVVIHVPGDVTGEPLPGSAVGDALVAVLGRQRPAEAVGIGLAIAQLHRRPHGFLRTGL